MKRFIPVLFLCLFLIACKDPYGACVKASADIGTGIAQGMKTVDSLRVQGLISVAEESNVLDYLEFANTADRAFLTCAQTAHTAGSKVGSFTACVTGFNSALNNQQELALLHISNTQGSQNVNIIVSGITTGIAAVAAALGGA